MILDIIKEGRIVPSEITVELIRKAMEASNANKVLIDGFPRCEENRIAFERIVSSQFDFDHCVALIFQDSLLTDWVDKYKLHAVYFIIFYPIFFGNLSAV